MKKQGCEIFLLVVFTSLLSGCISSVWTGATMIYDRHDVYKKLDNYSLDGNAHHALFKDKVFKQPGCSLDLAIFNNDILIAGHVPSAALRSLAESRLRRLTGYRRIYNQVAVKKEGSHTIQDSWITMKIRSQIFADAEIDPSEFKIITSDRIVYVMGDITPDQARRVLHIARNTSGVLRVVKLINYYHLSKKEHI
ncbi:BON domain-containing protein [Legionella spiritensis]|uniref:BON domain-containing protein n=1 Tax=Legionella spiritensis TaxID=452 RepID=UPI000F6C76C0|nr:BON domain-containing protein [Legionella spiritensis]VEG91576.1 hemolysin, lipoprotein [Legionella spiritensis]